MVPLEKPIRSGWVRYFVLREDLLHTKSAKTYLYFLNKLNTKIVCNRKDFVTRDYETKNMVPIEQKLHCLNRHEYEGLPPGEQKYFKHVMFYKKVRGKLEEHHEWHFASPDVFVFRIRPNYIKEVPAIYPELEGEKVKINDKLYHQREYYKYGENTGCSCCKDDWHGVKRRILNKVLDKEMVEELY